MALRELPCPYRIIDDFGGAFSMGCCAGCILYFVKGFVWIETIINILFFFKKRDVVRTKKRKTFWWFNAFKEKVTSSWRYNNLIGV